MRIFSHTVKEAIQKRGCMAARRILCAVLCFVMLASALFSVTGFSDLATINGTPTDTATRIADGDTSDKYKLLSDEYGSRYAGRVWTDKSVIAHDTTDQFQSYKLDSSTDGYDGSVGFNADFLHIYSALASSQVVNEWPPAPIDLVIAIDMSASMAQSTNYAVNAYGDSYNGGNGETMSERIKNSRIQQTLDAVNQTIDELMLQNKENRVSVVVYGAGAAVLMPLSHYAKRQNAPYLTVGGMETLYDLEDLKYDSEKGWVWTRNRDACYTIVANALKKDGNNPVFSETTDTFMNSVSNNVDNSWVKANPGYENWDTIDKNYKEQFNTEQKQLKANKYVGYFTNTQGGIYLAYAQLAKTKDTTFTGTLSGGENVTVARIPAAIIMTDGGANFAFNQMDNWQDYYGSYGDVYKNDWNKEYPYFRSDDTSANHIEPSNPYQDQTDLSHRLGMNKGDEWYNVYLPGVYDNNKITSLYNRGMVDKNGKLESAPAWANAGIFYNNDNDPFGTTGTILQLLMTASYMKSVVNNHYQDGWNDGNATNESRVSLATYTMSVDSKNLPQWGRLRLYPTMDPKNYFLSDSQWENEQLFGGDLSSSMYMPGLRNALNGWNNWKNDNISVNIQSGEIKVNIKRLPDGGNTDARFDNVTVTNEDVIKNIVYNDGFYDVSTEDIGEKFKEILSLIRGKVFIPLSGNNDAGVSDSITYQDPIGLYMELKNQAIKATIHSDSSEEIYDMALTVFGEMHGLVRTGVYDYQWNDKYILHKFGEDLRDKTLFPMGWYRGDDPEKAEAVTEGLPDGCNSEADAWNSGWVYRLDFNTTAQYIPILNKVTSREDITDQQKKTVYTIYRFAGNSQSRNALHRNPIYGEEIPENLTSKWAEYSKTGEYPEDNTDYRDIPGVYRMSDIRVWAENTGDFVDSEGTIAPNTGYTDSLYVNIPTAAIPSQLAEITLGPDGPVSYKTNLADKEQSTPIRLFYTVGLAESLIERDENGSQSGINIAALPAEYLNEHRTSSGGVYFNSNYYSHTVYEGYTSDSENYRTRGDAAVSFSPNVDNRYYIFQKPLPLYAHAYRVINGDGDIAPVDRQSSQEWESNGAGNGKTTWETYNGKEQDPATWEGGVFLGTYASKEQFQNALKNVSNGVITDMKGYSYTYKENGIIFLEEDEMDHVTSDNSGNYVKGSKSFSSDDYFFLCIDYYKPVPNTTGTDVRGNEIAGTQQAEKLMYVVSRKGSAFGSGLHSENIDNGDMLCWTDIKGNCSIEIEYNSRTLTGDNTRGEPTLEKLTYNEEQLREYLKAQGLKSDDGGTAEDGTVIPSTLEQDVQYWLNVQNDPKMANLIDQIKKSANPQEEYNKLFDWSVAARTGGLRTGDMYQNIQTKGGELNGDYYTGNVTQTANNYYCPTISNTSGTGNNAVINNYLGNNGRLEVQNTEIYVTKQVEVPEDGVDYSKQKQTKFNYQIYLQNTTGETDATLLRYNHWANNGKGAWQQQISTMDIKTSNEGLLQTAQSSLAVVDKDGKHIVKVGDDYYDVSAVDMTTGQLKTDQSYSPIDPKRLGDSGPYYVYIGGNTLEGGGISGENVRRIFVNDRETIYEELAGAGRTVYIKRDELEGGTGGGNQTPGKYWTVYGNADDKNPSGSIDFWMKEVYLVPVSEVDGAMLQNGAPGIELTSMMKQTSLESQDSSGWQWDDSKKEDYIHIGYTDDKYDPDTKPFVIAHMQNVLGDTGVTITSDYSITTAFMTMHLTFGVDQLYDGTVGWNAQAEKDIEKIKANTAEFTLSNDEGLLFQGLTSGTNYRITEQGKELNGFLLKQAVHDYGANERTYEIDNSNTQYGAKVTDGTTPNPNNFAARFGSYNRSRYYSVFGTTETNAEGVRYTNVFIPSRLSISKVLAVGDDAYLTDEDYKRDFKFTLELTDPQSDPPTLLSGPFTYQITEKQQKKDDSGKPMVDEHNNPIMETVVVQDGTLLANKSTTYSSYDIPAAEDGIWHFNLKGGQTMTVNDLPVGTSYNYQVAEEPTDGFVAQQKMQSGTVPPPSNVNDPPHESVIFVNTKTEKENALTVEKKIENDDPDTEKQFDFTLTLAPPDGEQLKIEDLTVISTTADGNAGGQTITVTWSEPNADGTLTGTFKLRHGEKITVIGIPTGTSYTVTEGNQDDYHLQRVEDSFGNKLTLNTDKQSVSGTIDALLSSVYLTFINVRALAVPFAGGLGWLLWSILGALLLLLSPTIYLIYRKRRSHS